MEDAADSKSAEVYPSWGFESPLRHQAAEAPDEGPSSCSTARHLSLGKVPRHDLERGRVTLCVTIAGLPSD